MGIVQSRGGESDGGVREVFVGGVKAGVPHHSCQPCLGMGSLGGPHARTGSVRSAPRQPMPDAVELERRFTKVLVSIHHPHSVPPFMADAAVRSLACSGC
ncbi:hypothetical protein X777_02958 [Ooceraea biroi]|uniref:Uncharacterized protein n=1 Tax=Ooceraea biroi TaxID=2015173 RepID=A0A026WMJ4_OOCBI|nr:hypothetical protein X777_02958 [Ooceraea biroi]